MPLLRYRTGDISRFMREPCPCGTVLKRMAHVDERVDSRVTLPGGSTLSQGDFDEVLLPIDGLTDFKVLFGRDHDHANVVLRVRCDEAGSGPVKDEIMRSLAGLPALAAEMAQKRLSVELSDWEHGHVVNSGTAKRKIEYLQEAAL
jgi:phenylacetate-CoA ligase